MAKQRRHSRFDRTEELVTVALAARVCLTPLLVTSNLLREGEDCSAIARDCSATLFAAWAATIAPVPTTIPPMPAKAGSVMSASQSYTQSLTARPYPSPTHGQCPQIGSTRHYPRRSPQYPEGEAMTDTTAVTDVDPIVLLSLSAARARQRLNEVPGLIAYVRTLVVPAGVQRAMDCPLRVQRSAGPSPGGRCGRG